jgi:hypothetical protein
MILIVISVHGQGYSRLGSRLSTFSKGVVLICSSLYLKIGNFLLSWLEGHELVACQSPSSEDVSMEAEEYPMMGAAT